MARYAKRLLKEDLLKGGITNITEDCRVFRNGQELELKKNYAGGYFAFVIYELDSNGNKIKVPQTRKNGKTTYVYSTRSIGLHRAMWAWFYNEVPAGMVVDHINNKHSQIEDYYLDNLQLLTPQENITKERECNTRQMVCDLSYPRSHYEERLATYEAAYSMAKETSADKEVRHRLTSSIAHTRAQLRYYDAHIEQAEQLQKINTVLDLELAAFYKSLIENKEDKKDLEELKYWKKVFKEQGNKVMWRECLKVEKLWDSMTPIVKQSTMKTLRDFVRR